MSSMNSDSWPSVANTYAACIRSVHAEQATGSGLPPSELPRTRPDTSDLWDFDDEDEMTRRLPRLAALFLEPPE